MYETDAVYFMKIASNKDFNKLWENHIKGILEEYLRGNKNKDIIMSKFKNAYNRQESN